MKWMFGLAGVLLGLAAGPAPAAVEVSSSMEPRRVEFGVTPSVSYRIELHAVDAPEQLWVGVDSNPGFVAPELGRFGEGAGFGYTGFRTEGALRVEYFSGPTFSDRPNCGRDVGYHGTGTGMPIVGVSLGAGERGAIVYDAPVGARAPWTPEDLGLRFVVRRRNPDGTLTEPIAASSPPLPELPRRGVKILMSSQPAMATDASGPFPPGIAGGVPITLEGRTIPALGGEVLTLHAARDDETSQTLGTVRLNAAGGFSYSGYRPAEPGRYEVWATYASTRPDLTDDYLCPLAFRLTSPGPPADRAWVAAERSGRRSVRVRIACPRVAACRGSLRIRRRGAARGGKARRYAVVAGRPASVRLTMPRRRRGDGPVRIELSERTPRAQTRRVPLR